MPCIQDRGQCPFVQRLGAQETLVKFAPLGGQQVTFTLGLHAFGNRLQSQAACDGDDPAHDHASARIPIDVIRQAAIDLQIIEWQRLQIGKAGITRAEIVDRDPQPLGAQSIKADRRSSKIGNEAAFRNLRRHAARIDPASIDQRLEIFRKISPGEIGGSNVHSQP